MLTILFATFNGMQTLPRMMERLKSIQHPEGLRIVAVDNRSTDGSGDYLRSMQAVLPLTILHCPQPGKNRSLNFALDQIAAGLNDRELVVITDDDILPEDEWLLQLSRSALAHPEANAFGGIIQPVWPDQVPAWLPRLKYAYPVLFATTSARHGPCTSRDIYGPNMAIRARLFKRRLRFNAAIGPDGSKTFGMGSESELLRRIERMGHKMFFCEHAIVGHQIKPSLLRWSAVLSRARRYGVGLGMMDRQERPTLTECADSIAQLFVLESKALASLFPGLTQRRAGVLFRRQVQLGRLSAMFAAPLDPQRALGVLTRLTQGLRQRSDAASGLAAASVMTGSHLSANASPSR